MAKPRVGGKKFGSQADRTPADNVAWVTTESAKVTLIAQANEKEEHDDLILGTGQMGRVGGSMLNLTTMTEEELLAVKQVIDQAFELAQPVVRRRDEIANEAFDAGDDSFDRVYRSVPRVVSRAGAVQAYVEGVLLRPTGTAAGQRDGVDQVDEAGEASVDVAEPDPVRLGPGHDWSPPNLG